MCLCKHAQFVFSGLIVLSSERQGSCSELTNVLVNQDSNLIALRFECNHAMVQVIAHMMPDLPNVGWERDMESFREFFENPAFRSDGLKVRLMCGLSDVSCSCTANIE